ncbi:HD-GYP domain-containing protein [Paenibacillus senegalimassiliensis]|uniref:HD-GYP domain-containing protein n=1 Tax=Paenibacillus senegalimassiliensis TaxID=1737426 RepID=UPI0009E8843C|nr:HD-GYP domain-containing protein [Paenibacillus senegalimassiliensis]
MKEVHVRMLEPGDVLAEPILNQQGMTMLGAGTALTENHITRLKKLRIQTAIITTVDSPGVQLPGEAGSQNAANANGLRLSFLNPNDKQEMRKRIRNSLVGLADSEFGFGRPSTPELEQQFHRVFRSVLHEITNRQEVIDGLILLHQSDPYLLDHSFHVTAYSAILGIANQYSSTQMTDLCIGALLYDIGMTELPTHTLNRTGTLTEPDREAMLRHPEIGYRMIREMKGVSPRSALCALQHHERYNGTGYPSRLKHGEIDEFAEIVAIADTYHALISRRNYRLAYTPGEAIEYLLAVGDRYFSLDMIQTYLRHISIYPLASKVKLSNGQLGIVSSLDPSVVHRPVVRIIQEADGTAVEKPYEVNLMRTTNLVISGIVEGSGRDDPYM